MKKFLSVILIMFMVLTTLIPSYAEELVVNESNEFEDVEIALETSDVSLPNDAEIILKRAGNFRGTLFSISKGAEVTFGEDKYPLYIDGNEQVTSSNSNQGIVIDIRGENSRLNFNNAAVYNSNGSNVWAGTIAVNDGATMEMNGGRITNNKMNPNGVFNGGAIYVGAGGTFIMNGGMIDHNEASQGGIVVGDFYNPDYSEKPAQVTINAGAIVNNHAKGPFAIGGGLSVITGAEATVNNGILAGNNSDNVGEPLVY